jgi:pilus assembly protein CpaB
MGRRAILLIVAVVIAALGATLVFLYVRGVEAQADEDREVVQVLGVDKTITAGETADDAIAAGKMRLIEVPRENVLDGALVSTDPLTGLVALTTMYPGEQVVPQKWGASGTQTTITIPEKMMAISVQLTDPQRVAGYISPGSKVAIFLSATPLDESGRAAEEGDFTRLLFPEVEVIGVGSTTLLTQTTTDQSGAQTTEQLPRTILTLALTQAQAERIIFAQGHGELSMGLLTEESVVKQSLGVNGRNLFQ